MTEAESRLPRRDGGGLDANWCRSTHWGERPDVAHRNPGRAVRGMKRVIMHGLLCWALLFAALVPVPADLGLIAAAFNAFCIFGALIEFSQMLDAGRDSP